MRWAEFYLVLVAVLWGLTFPLIETSMELQDPFLFVALRFTLATLPILPYFLRNLTKELFWAGVVIGFLNCGAFVTQTIGLQTVSASRAAFLTGVYVFLIPLLSPLFRMGRPGMYEILSAALCFLGVYVLTGCDTTALTLGDLWVLSGAVFIAISVIYIGKYSKDNLNPYMIAYSQIAMTALFAWMLCPFFSTFNFTALQNPQFLLSLTICSLLATILTIVLQCKYQKYVSLAKVTLIFSLEPVFAAIFDWMLNGVTPTIYTTIGGGLVLLSIVCLELFKPKETIHSHQDV
jgi:drug/metabolite transporter (DMT)-like permease